MAALGLSATLHAGVILLFDVAPQGATGPRPVVIAARLTDSPSPPPLERPPPTPVPEPVPGTPPKEVPLPPPQEIPETAAPIPGTKTARVAAPDDPRLKLDVPLVVDPTYYAARELDVPPRALDEIEPVFPQAAMAAQIAGYVILELRIDQAGNVESVEVSDAKPPRHFDESAKRAFAGKRFSPAVKNGQAVKALVRIRVDYLLDEDQAR